jgi:DNA-binding PadR family transcriptional regulator
VQIAQKWEITMIILTRAEEIILLAIHKLKDDAYGVTIRQQVYEDIGIYWAFGAIYKTLKKMKAKGYVEKIASEPLAERGGRTKYYYRLTSEGKNTLQDIARVNASLWDGSTRLEFEK